MLPNMSGRNKHDYVYLSSGISHIAIKDYYISKEKYSGLLIGFEFGFRYSGVSNFHDLNFSFKRGDGIDNYNIDADVLLFNLNQNYFYKILDNNLFAKPLMIYLGPSLEIFTYFREEDIARVSNSIFYAYSFLGEFSGGIQSLAELELSENISIINLFGVNLCSVGFRMVDTDDDNNSIMDFTSVNKNINFNSATTLTYSISKNLSIGCQYNFHFVNNRNWDKLYLMTDSLKLIASYCY